MSNLNNNTTQLEALLAKVNALPEAGGGTNTSDATATSDEIFAGETAYGVEGKLIGTFTIENELAEQSALISQITTLVASKTSPQGGIDTSDATATAEDLLSGKTAYVNGEKINGTHSCEEALDAELTAQENLIYQLSNILDSKASGVVESPETCTITYHSLPSPGSSIYYINENSELCIELLAKNSTYTVLKNSLFLLCTDTDIDHSMSGGTLLTRFSSCMLYQAKI